MKTNTYITEKLKELKAIVKTYKNLEDKGWLSKGQISENVNWEEIENLFEQSLQDAIKYGERRERERMKGIFNLMADTMGVIDRATSMESNLVSSMELGSRVCCKIRHH